MDTQQRIENIKAGLPTVILLLIAMGCIAGIALILIGQLPEYKEHLSKLIGVLMVIAGLSIPDDKGDENG